MLSDKQGENDREKEILSQNSSQFGVKEFLEGKNVISVIPKRDHLQNIRKKTKPIYQKTRFVIFLFGLVGVVLSIGLGIGLHQLHSNSRIPIPPPRKTPGVALNYQFAMWGAAPSTDCLAIILDKKSNIFLSESTHANTYMHTYSELKTTGDNFSPEAELSNSDVYQGALQLFNVTAISTNHQVTPKYSNSQDISSQNFSSLNLVGGNVFGISLWTVNIAASLSFGAQLPWDKNLGDTDPLHLCSKQLEAKMSFSYDLNASIGSQITKITFKSLASKANDVWKQNYNFAKQDIKPPKKLFLPLLKNAANTSSAIGNSTSKTEMQDLYDDSYTSFSYSPNDNNLLDDSYFNQPVSNSNSKPLFNDILFPKNGLAHDTGLFRNDSAKAVPFIGVRTPYVFSSDFVNGVGINKSLTGQPFFSNMLFSKLKLAALNETAYDPTTFPPGNGKVYGLYPKDANNLYNSRDESKSLSDYWSMIGVSQYYGLTGANQKPIFKPSTTDPIAVKSDGALGSGNHAQSRHDAADIHNILSTKDGTKTATIAGNKMFYPGFAYNSLPFYNFTNDKTRSTSKIKPFSQYDLGLYHSADLGQAINQMVAKQKQTIGVKEPYGQSNTSVANIANGLGMANISFGDSSNPYSLNSNNSPIVNLYDQLLSIKAATLSGNDFYNLDSADALNSQAYSQGMPTLRRNIPHDGASASDIFFNSYDTDNSSQTNINNFLLALVPRVILKSYLIFVPYDHVDKSNNTGTTTDYNNDAKKWALALIMPQGLNLACQNPLIPQVVKSPLNPAFKIHNNWGSTSSQGDLLDHGGSLDGAFGYNNLSFKVTNKDVLPPPTNWWASMDDRSVFDSNNANFNPSYMRSDPTLQVMSEVGVSHDIWLDNGKSYPNLSFVYNDNSQFTTMSAHPGAFSWIPFEAFAQ